MKIEDLNITVSSLRMITICLKLTAFPGRVAPAARKAAILSVVPVQTTQSFGKPGRKSTKKI